MKTIKNDYCIRQFVGNDNLRPQLNQVSFDNGYIYATDAHIVGAIKADLCIKSYEQIVKFPNAAKVISDHVSIDTKKVSVETLFNDLMKIEVCFKPKMVDCKECDGDGTVTCPYCDSEHDCKECKGTGKIKSSELELSGEYDCVFFGKNYNLKYLDIIIRTAIYTGVTEITVSNGDGYSGTLFYVGDFTILLMPRSV
jgi:hypothetical protein